MIKNTKFFKFDFLNFILSRKANGFTILLSVLVVSIVLSVGMGIFGTMTKELKLSGMGRESQLAFYAADAGIECFFYWEIKHPDLADTAFGYYDSNPPAVKCAGNNTVMPVKSNGPYDLILNLGNNSCAKVNIAKDTSLSNKVITTVTSRGYNTVCDSNSPFKVERAIQLVSTKQQGEGTYLPPDAPKNLNITQVSLGSETNVKLNWANDSCEGDSSCSYSLYRSIDGNIFSLVSSGITTNTYVDSGPVSTILYNYYHVTASDAFGESSESNAVRVSIIKNPVSLSVFAYTESYQPWTVPVGVTNITVGSFGASGKGSSNSGGLGGFSTSNISVSPGQIIYIYVGGQNGWNGSTGCTLWCNSGGGASDVRIDTNNNGSYELQERVIVAGGGGGGSRSKVDAITSITLSGGNGGGLAGINGESDITVGSLGGKGGTDIAGGAVGGGCGGYGYSRCLNYPQPGSLGSGGSGGFNNCSAFGGSGNGGGGYYGGGGGAASCYGGGAGGGGSSFVPSGGMTVIGVRSGNGLVGIEY